MYVIHILEMFIESVTVGRSEKKKSEFSKRGDLLATIVSPEALPQATRDLRELGPLN